MFKNPFRRPLLTLSIAVAGLGSALAAAPVQAQTLLGALSPAGTSCAAPAESQPFLPWQDASFYRLVPGSTFAGAASGWTLSGGAAVVPGGDPYDVTGSGSPASLSLPAGASAQSPFTCVDVAQPTFRFFAVGQTSADNLLVQAVYQEPLGLQVVLPVGTLLPDDTWEPSPAMLTGSLAGVVLTGGTAQMALRFTAIRGVTLLDDVFVDPRMRT
jgi:hypothetical protein